jgi:hypothetical protein
MNAAPEVAQGYSESYRYGLETDIFPLGCVFLEMAVVAMGHSVMDLRRFILLEPSSPKASQDGSEGSHPDLVFLDLDLLLDTPDLLPEPLPDPLR